jgi:lysophospholipase L1-like esterase
LLLKPQSTIPQAQQFEARADARLEQLRRLCEAHGAKLILLVPPTPYSEDAVREMTFASQKAGVEALVPIDPATLSTKYYQPDELHLNSEGAALFTSALATFLPPKVHRDTIASPD